MPLENANNNNKPFLSAQRNSFDFWGLIVAVENKLNFSMLWVFLPINIQEQNLPLMLC